VTKWAIGTDPGDTFFLQGYDNSGNPVQAVAIDRTSATVSLPHIPQSNPGSGSHYVCATDSGALFRSDTACHS